jgi:hypothetical protein
MASTTNYGLYQPLVNNSQDEDSWGGELNTDLSEIDGVLYTAMNLTASAQTSTITVTAPTTGSTTTGSSNTLYLCNATGGAFAANLPSAATATNMVVAFKKTDSSTNAITITGHSTDTIDGVNTQSLSTQYQYLVLECDGTHWNIIAQTSASEVFSVNTQSFTSSGTYTPTSGMSYCIVEMWGGGGGGGAGVTSGFVSPGAGGGAGGYSRATFSAGTIGTSQTVTIGAGGTAGNSSNGGTGGTTSLGSLLTAAGGLGGPYSPSSSLSYPGGLGGAGSVNGVTTKGAPGGTSSPTSNGNDSFTGNGGSTLLGGAGVALVGQSLANGNSATANSGSGGSGGMGYGGNATGGTGGSGLVIITEYIT